MDSNAATVPCVAEVAVIVESFNETEHSSVERLAAALEAARREARTYGDARVLLADSGGNPRVERLLAERFPDVERLEAGACDYDLAKNQAAGAADARVVAYLDGDCLPADGWLAALVRPILSGDAVATGGFTTYEGGWLSRVLSVMDFGFLLPRRRRPLGCYASNNVAFAADALERTPIPPGEMRCQCYAHAQLFERQGTPLRLEPDARVRHEALPIVNERLRRGWDIVTAARVDPELTEARWLGLGLRAAPLFWLHHAGWDMRRAIRSGGDVGLGPAARVAAVPVMLALRLLDLFGIVTALRGKPVPQL
jgi:Glycosyl transferase family 2